MVFDPREPYDGLPLLPPATELETRAVLKQCLGATRALAELKGAGGLIPDQTILINTIPLQEAKLSSEIENIVTTQDELFHAALDEASATVDPQAKEILLYRRALRRGYEAVVRRGVSKDLLLEVGNILLGKEISFRSSQELVYIGNQRASTITYTPPRGGRPCLTSWTTWRRSFSKRRGWTRWFAWRSLIINSKRSTPSQMATAELAES